MKFYGLTNSCAYVDEVVKNLIVQGQLAAARRISKLVMRLWKGRDQPSRSDSNPNATIYNRW